MRVGVTTAKRIFPNGRTHKLRCSWVESDSGERAVLRVRGWIYSRAEIPRMKESA